MLKTVTCTKSQHIISDLKQHTNFFHDKKVFQMMSATHYVEYNFIIKSDDLI